MNFLLTSGIFYPDIGGPSSYLRELIKYIINTKKSKVCIITFGDINKSYKIYLTKNIEVIKINRNRNKFIRFLITVFIIFIKFKKNTSLYANGLFFEVGLISIIKNKTFISKIVGDYHWERFIRLGYTESSIKEFNKKKYIFIINLIRKISFLKCKKIIVPSIYLKKVVISWGLNKEFEVINNFFTKLKHTNKKTDSKFDEILKIKKNKKIVLTVSRLVKHKNIDFLIKSLNFNNYILIIIGSGPEYCKIQKLIKENKLEDNIFLLGSLEKTEVYEAMTKSNIFLLHSSYEGFPHVVLEAMSNNIVCLVSNVGGNSELIKNNYNGYLTELFNIKDLNTKIDLILSNNRLEIILSNARLTLKRFDKEQLLKKTFNVLS